jgi:hypothetical protein
MDESSVWEAPRFITLLVVLALHLALLAVLLMASRSSHILASADPPLELMFVPPTENPSVTAKTLRPRRVNAQLALSPVMPDLDSGRSAATSGSGLAGNGSAVNWAAEAHRAVKAFEIRRDHRPNHAESAAAPAWESWWPQTKHHAGDQYKTESGDWIVWINASCYQIASWHAGAPALNTAEPQTICIDEAAAH